MKAEISCRANLVLVLPLLSIVRDDKGYEHDKK